MKKTIRECMRIASELDKLDDDLWSLPEAAPTAGTDLKKAAQHIEKATRHLNQFIGSRVRPEENGEGEGEREQLREVARTDPVVKAAVAYASRATDTTRAVGDRSLALSLDALIDAVREAGLL